MTIDEIKREMEEAGLTYPGKVHLRDGRTGERFHYPVTVGFMYIIKLIHMVEDKLHARAIGPYSSITQQPVGGKSHFGGQRFGEMEVWALESHGAAYTLQEMLTIKSDDIDGRNILYKDLQLGKRPKEPGLPASFNVLVNHLKGLCLDVELKTLESKTKQGLREKQQ
jgi:DNA-directed RNA polymerase subunit beta